MNDILHFQKGIQGRRILVIGDVMLDHYLYGNSNRISPEAPVPVVNLEKSEYRLGGAANVALNIQAMGAMPYLCGMIGKDESANRFFQLMEQENLNTDFLFSSGHRPTTKKSRILGNGQHLLRVDEESTADLSTEESGQAFDLISQAVSTQKPEVILFQDYNKGFLTETLIQQIIGLAKQHGIKTIVDPKFKNFLSYKGVDLFKPNLKELREGLGKNIEVSEASLRGACQMLQEKIQAKSILVTLSEHGVFAFENDSWKLIPTLPREILDVCGAGDAVIAVCALALLANLDATSIGQLANLAGGLVCESLGVVPIPAKSFFAELGSPNFYNTPLH
ncbi:MAG: D-glycero-beta-D-manno-heptose-7-phosphate kinase [Saprospiraceae bacterium]|nr:D-glycero-beta-D-manno-heptose-7-phosphate kinase [Saprospiraceae bacterium]